MVFLTMVSEFAYDKVVYPSFVFPYIRPSKFGAIARLHGIDVGAIDRCRVLEIGCGDGANLMSIAYAMPDADCVGFDLSGERIEEAKDGAREVGISNASFYEMDLMEFDPGTFGKFDFIIAHGFYSWVPDAVRESMLAIYRNCLTPKGIGYISYNTLPGWHFRRFARDAMRFQSSLIEDPLEKVDAGIRFLRFIAGSLPPEAALRPFIEEETVSIENAHPSSTYHDDLADVNHPFYFEEFVEGIEKAGLRFLAESEPVSNFLGRFPRTTQDALNELWHDYLRREQYIDFLRMRKFRSSLVCHLECEPSYRVEPAALDTLYVASKVRPIDDGIVMTDDSVATYQGPFESEFELNHPLVKTALNILARSHPAPMRFDKLIEELRARFADQAPGVHAAGLTVTRAYFVELINSNAVEIFCFESPLMSSVLNDHPKISEFARWQAGRGAGVVNGLYGAAVKVTDEETRELIGLADGTRDTSGIISELSRTLGDHEEGRFEDFVRSNLELFRSSGLLIK